MSNEATYQAHRAGLEGQVFYDNLLAAKPYQKIYFPLSAGQSVYSYEQAPKVVIPITRTFIHKITASLQRGMEVTIDNTSINVLWEEIEERIDWNELTYNLLTNTLVGGNILAVITTDNLNQVQVDQWLAPYVFDDGYFIGYEYILRDGTDIIPILEEPKRLKQNEILIRVPMDNYLIGDVEHNLGFTPGVLFKNIDKTRNGLYGIPYFMRYKDLNIEYNQVFSQVSKAIKILQNVWVTNSDPENPDRPISMDPEKINFVGENGKLEQVIRQLDTDPETQYLVTLMRHISNAAQIPDLISDLQGIGKVSSGVALEIVSAPMLELTSRIRNEFKEDLYELVDKIIKTQLQLMGVSIPNYDINIIMNENILPTDRQQEIATILQLVQAGIITTEQAQTIILPLMGIVEEPNDTRRS